MANLKKIIFVIFLICIIIILYLKKSDYIQTIDLLEKIFNIRVKNVINKEKLDVLNNKNEKFIIMANHFFGYDYLPILSTIKNYLLNTNRKLYTVTKYDICYNTKKAPFYADFIKNNNMSLVEKFNFLPYDRYNDLIKPNDVNHPYHGHSVLRRMLEELNKNNIILLFPAGKRTGNGHHDVFKAGAFKLAALNNIKILPLTIKYEKLDKNLTVEPQKDNRWMNNKVTIIVHDLLEGSDWQDLREKTRLTIMNAL